MDNGHMSAPPHILDGIRQYVEHRIPPGGFVNAVLENDLKEAFARADNESLAGMFGIVSFCYNEIPGTCWGSPERVKAWLAGGEAPADPPGLPDIPEKTEPGPMPREKQADDTPLGEHGMDPLMTEEWDAWKVFMRHFYDIAGQPTEEEINAPAGAYNSFFVTLRTWSEKLALLRRVQPRVLEVDERGYVSRRTS